MRAILFGRWGLLGVQRGRHGLGKGETMRSKDQPSEGFGSGDETQIKWRSLRRGQSAPGILRNREPKRGFRYVALGFT